MSTMKCVLPLPGPQTTVNCREALSVSVTPLAMFCPVPNQLIVDDDALLLPPRVDREIAEPSPYRTKLASVTSSSAGTVMSTGSLIDNTTVSPVNSLVPMST